MIEETKRLSGLKVEVDRKLERNVRRKVNRFLKTSMDRRQRFILRDVYAIQRGKHVDIFLTITFSGRKSLEDLDRIRELIQDKLEEGIPHSDIDII